ncbi:hypothetical protein D3C78_987260 [compost metagenome]
MVTGENHTFVQHNRLAFTRLFHFGVTWHTTRRRGRLIHISVHQTEFQRRCRTQNFFGARSVLDTRQFYHDTVRTLALYQRLSNTKLVYTVTQDIDVLLYRVFTCFAQTRIGHHGTQLVATLT